MKIVTVIKCVQNVDDLNDYEATSIEEAAKNQDKWVKEGRFCYADILEWADHFEIVSCVGLPSVEKPKDWPSGCKWPPE